MKVVKIDGRSVKVFVLQENDESLAYIPVNAIAEVDYKRLTEIEKKGGEMLREMSRTTLDNGRNALVQYDNVIQIMRYTDKRKGLGKRVRKPGEPKQGVQGNQNGSELSNVVAQLSAAVATLVNNKASTPQQSQEEKPRKKPGPKPGFKRGRQGGEGSGETVSSPTVEGQDSTSEN